MYSSSLPQATVAENLTQAMGSQTNLDREDAVRRCQASLSIKKLQSLTILDSQGVDPVQQEGQNGIERKKSRFSFKKKNKEASEEKVSVRADGNKDVVEFEESDDLLPKPKFFTSDMLSVIMERNELKEKVHQLEEKIQQLET